MKRLLFLVLVVFCYKANAQQLISFDSLNKKRIKTNTLGMAHLGAWGAVNVAAGGVGYFVSSDREWKSFHGMNAIWGVTNLAIAYMGYRSAKNEARKTLTIDEELHRYEQNKKLFLLNAGLDVLYIGTGVTLHAYVDQFEDTDMWSGFGKSIALQGIALLIFDGTMYTLHGKQDKKWYKLLQGVVVTGNGVGYRYGF